MALKHSVKPKNFPQQNTKPLIDVPLDKTGKLANTYVDILNEIKQNQEELVSTGADLIDALKEQHRTDITVRGVTLKVKEIEAKIKIVVKSPKEE